MSAKSKSQRHPIFLILLLLLLISLAAFILTISKIAKEFKAGVQISWTTYYLSILSVLTCVHATVSISIFEKLPARPASCCSAFIIASIVFSVAWAPAIVAGIFDPNNDLVNRNTNPTLEKPLALRIRIALYAIIALLSLSNALLAMHRSFRQPNEPIKTMRYLRSVEERSVRTPPSRADIAELEAHSVAYEVTAPRSPGGQGFETTPLRGGFHTRD